MKIKELTRPFPLHKQHEENDCAVACVKMILQYYGYHIPYQTIREAINTDNSGTNLHSMIVGVENVGLTAHGYFSEPGELEQYLSERSLKLPLMALTTNNHFVVVYKYNHKNKQIYIADPAGFKRHISCDDFDKMFTGYSIVLKPVCESKAEISQHSRLKTVRAAFQEYNKPLTIISITSILIVLISIVDAFVFQYVLDVSEGSHFHTVHGGDSFTSRVIERIAHFENHNAVFCILLFLIALQVVLFVFRGIVLYRFSMQIHMKCLLDTHDRFINGNYYTIQCRQTGEYLARLNDVENIKRAIASSSYIIVVDLVAIVIGFVVLCAIDTVLSIIVVFMILLYICFVFIFTPIISRTNYKVMEAEASAEAYYKEVIDCCALVKKTNTQKRIQKKVNKTFHRKLESQYNADKVKLILQALLSAVESGGLLLVLWLGLVIVKTNQISIGELITFYMLTTAFITPLNDLVELQPQIQSAIVSLERLKDILDMAQEQSGRKKFEHGDVLFNEISFGYSVGGGKDVLSDFCLTIKKDESIAIQGASGSGKTTLAKMLIGLYSPDSGEITIGGTNIKALDTASLRSCVGYVEQAEDFFSGTIYDNLTIGIEGGSKALLDDVFRDLKIGEFIEKEFPLGYDTYIEECGNNLSSGQKQKLSIVRALLMKPTILILDEALSNVTRMEAEGIIKSIIDNNCISSLILITHDNELANLCDRSVILQ